MCSLARTQGQTVGEIQTELLRRFPGELAAGEARMYAHGWTVTTVREGVQALAAADGLDASGLQDADVRRWLRCEVYPRNSLERLCRFFRCHQSQLGWPPKGTEAPVDFTPRAGSTVLAVPRSHPPVDLPFRTLPDPSAGGQPAPLKPGFSVAAGGIGAEGLGIAAAPGTHIISLRWVAGQGGSLDLIVELEDSDMDRRAALKLVGATAVMGLLGPTVDVEHVVSAAANPRLVDPGLIDGLRSITRILADQRQVMAPDALLVPLLAHRDLLTTLFRGATAVSLRRDLGNVLGETAVVASRLFSAAGDRGQALAHCALARDLATKLDDPALGATVRIFESNLHSGASTLIDSMGDVQLGLRILGEAAAAGRLLSPAARARIAAEQAQTYAVLGLRTECRQALEQAHQEADEITNEDRVGLFSDWSTARLSVYEGTCWLFLAEPKMAVRVLEEALHVLVSRHPSLALAAKVDLGSAYAEEGRTGRGLPRPRRHICRSRQHGELPGRTARPARPRTS